MDFNWESAYANGFDVLTVGVNVLVIRTGDMSPPRISEQTAVFSLYVINWLVFITVVESAYSAVRTDSLYKADYV